MVLAAAAGVSAGAGAEACNGSSVPWEAHGGMRGTVWKGSSVRCSDGGGGGDKAARRVWAVDECGGQGGTRTVPRGRSRHILQKKQKNNWI